MADSFENAAPAPGDPQLHPGLAVLRMAGLLADAEARPEAEGLDELAREVAAGALRVAAPPDIWRELQAGLMRRRPSQTIEILRRCGALAEILPEVAALFGVPQLSDGAAEIDIGDHLLRALDEAAACAAPLPVRFALLVENVGKADSPREHLPAHYRHMERGAPRIEAICTRFDVSRDCRDLAMAANAECERVHRVSRMRAGPIAAMLARLGAFRAQEHFALLMTLCACDWRGHPGRAGRAYPKAALLEIAFAACAGIVDSDDDATMAARAEAIALALRSMRWDVQE